MMIIMLFHSLLTVIVKLKTSQTSNEYQDYIFCSACEKNILYKTLEKDHMNIQDDHWKQPLNMEHRMMRTMTFD